LKDRRGALVAKQGCSFSDRISAASGLGMAVSALVQRAVVFRLRLACVSFPDTPMDHHRVR
jgi:hypothetical protein